MNPIISIVYFTGELVEFQVIIITGAMKSTAHHLKKAAAYQINKNRYSHSQYGRTGNGNGIQLEIKDFLQYNQREPVH